jgi:two-component system, LytTR family, sensor kinase
MMQKIIAQIVKYNVIHILFWSGICILTTINIGLHHGKQNSFAINLIIQLSCLISEIFSVYFILYFLKPHYLFYKKYFLFFISAICSVLVANAIGFYLQQLVTYLVVDNNKTLRFLPMYISTIFESLFFATLFLSVSLLYDFFAERIKNEVLQKEKLQAELNFLKGQMNPHFLFNAINSIFVLINEDKDEARKHLHTFSEMLRYQLYDCREDYILLSHEIQFIHHYLSLERIRKSTKTDINTSILTKQLSNKIAPFILITFIENACKYVRTNLLNETFIDIKITDEKNKLSFVCRNSIPQVEHTIQSKHQGIGLDNTLKRLKLLYPNMHQLMIERDKNYYTITLTIELS